ncbi:hypothetical protein [Phenylobacterium sp.]|uniref:hypothetical protein n=1 Tax=Phenylobacterium sp. TaxID=1871053 RepID=UPI0025FDEF5C|nr:hypothetical protein [Phenylobacterium sp.]
MTLSRSALLLPAALLCLAAAPAPKTPPARPAAAKAVTAKAAPAPAKPPATTTAGTFDATNPQGLMSILDAAGAKAQTSRREDDAVFVAVTSSAATFSMQFAGCNPQGRACGAVLLDHAQGSATVTGAQVNGFNQTSVMCRVYQDRAGQAHVVYSAILLKSMTRDDVATHLLAWQGCLADAADFLRDPVAYLANAV